MDPSSREQRNQDATIHVGNLDSLANEDLVWELCSHFGPVERVYIPRDKVTGDTAAYGFVEFALERDADYASALLNGVQLFGRTLRVSKASQTARALDVGANLFVGGLDESVDEQMLGNIFQAFGAMCHAPQVTRDLTSGRSLGYAFLAYDNFASSDAAIEAMNDQFVLNKQIRVMYAYKRGTTERHGSETERVLAACNAVQQQQQQQQHLVLSGANQLPIVRRLV